MSTCSPNRPDLLLACLCLALLACGDADIPDGRFSSSQTLPEDRLTTVADPTQRFGDTAGGVGHGSDAGPTGLPFAWDTPAGWQELAPSTYRNPNFSLPGGVEAYVSGLSGDGGGMVANIGRWAEQIGVAPPDAATISTWPRERIFGADAVRIAFDGSFSGMGGDAAIADARMIGYIVPLPQATFFVKMVGPRAAVAEQEDALTAFVRSLRMRADPAPVEDPAAVADTPPPAPAGAPPPENGTLVWTPPEGWEDQGASGMRLATLRIGEAECSIISLAGDGGGLAPNLRRWYGQMGAEPPSDEELAALPRLEMLGGEHPIVAVTGHFGGGMGAAPIDDAAMIGTAIIGRHRSYFIKLLGPREVVLAQRGAFEALCASLKEQP